MDASFSLGDLLRVGLHQAVDACSEIIDRAQKELIIEKALKKIEDTWGGLTLSFTPYQARTAPCVIHDLHCLLQAAAFHGSCSAQSSSITEQAAALARRAVQ